MNHDSLSFIIIATFDRIHGRFFSYVVTGPACSAGYGKDSQAEESLGRSRGGLTTKIHALVDGLGNPLKFILTPGQQHDITQAEPLTEGIKQHTLLADKGYEQSCFC